MATNRRTALGALVLSVLALAVVACESASAPRADRAPVVLPPGTRTIDVDADHAAGRYYRFWTVTNTVDPHLLAQPDGVEKLRVATPLMRTINIIFMMGGMWEGQNQWFLGVNADGSIRTDFTGMIAQLKAVTDAGYEPWIVLDDVPDNMSEPPMRNVYGNTAPPKDERVWHAYVQAAVESMVKTFGRERVGKWTFRVGTEPDLFPAHFSGTEEQYLAHYDYSVDAVKRVCPEARVGPGNILQQDGQPIPGRRAAGHVKWGLDIIDHAATGKNACTGGEGAPLDVFLTSWYEDIGMPTSAFDRAVMPIRERLNKYERFRHTPIEVGEFSVLRDEHKKHLYAGETTEWSASFYAALADHVYAQNVNQVYEWDHASLGVWHPRGRVIQMLDQMAGGSRLDVKVHGTTDAECGALACKQGDDLLLLVYNHRPDRGPAVSENVHIVVHDRRMAAGKKWHMTESTIDHDHGVWAYAFEADCKAAGIVPLAVAGLYEGSPTRLYGPAGLEIFKKNTAKYEALSVVPTTKDNVTLTVANGSLALDMELDGHSVRWIRLSPGRK